MPTKKFDPHDPFDLVGTVMPSEDGVDGVEEMARALVSEYLTMGWDPDVIYDLFKKPQYRGPNIIYRQMGEEYVRNLIADERESHRAMMARILGESVLEEV